MILPELSSFDVLGANGCNFLTPRCNLLVEFQLILLDDDTFKMWFDQFSPEGFGIGHCKTLLSCQTKIRIFSVLEHTSGIVLFDEQSTWQVVAKSSFHQRPNHALELFGGGMGGWKAAGNFLSTAFDQQWETIAVEQQLEVAMSYAITYNTGLLTSAEHLPRDFFCKHIPSWIICADVRDHSWFPLVAEWGVDALLLSPQCQPWQPWSGASASPGLVCLDGKLATSSVQRFFLKEIRWCNDKFSSDRRCCKRRCSCLGIGLHGICILDDSIAWLLLWHLGPCRVYGHCDTDLGSLWFCMGFLRTTQPLSLGIDILPLQAILFAFTFEPMEMDRSRELFRDFWCPLCREIFTVILAGCQTGCLRCPLGIFHTIVV